MDHPFPHSGRETRAAVPIDEEPHIEPTVIPRGTELPIKTEGYRFSTVYDVTLSPLRISNVRFSPKTVVPSDVVLPLDATRVVATLKWIEPFQADDLS